jgi:hypothetical protein
MWSQRYSLFFKKPFYITFKLACGPKTNNRAKLYVVLVFLKLASEKCINYLQLLGDSKIIIDREKGKNSLENLILLPLTEKFREVKDQFEMVSSQHVFRELNKITYKLFEEALPLKKAC